MAMAACSEIDAPRGRLGWDASGGCGCATPNRTSACRRRSRAVCTRRGWPLYAAFCRYLPSKVSASGSPPTVCTRVLAASGSASTTSGASRSSSRRPLASLSSCTSVGWSSAKSHATAAKRVVSRRAQLGPPSLKSSAASACQASSAMSSIRRRPMVAWMASARSSLLLSVIISSPDRPMAAPQAPSWASTFG